MEYYKAETILSDEEVDILKKDFDSLPSNMWHQDYNLFDTDKRHPTEEMAKKSPYAKLSNHVGLESMSHYFLKYGRDSFTKLHNDGGNGQRVGKTIVTLIEATPNLVGGEALIFLPYKKTRPKTAQVRRVPKEKDPTQVGSPPTQDCVPRVVPMSSGTSLIYEQDLMHAVTQVQQGHRIVLVSWFYEDKGE